jgi:hypothetical protein
MNEPDDSRYSQRKTALIQVVENEIKQAEERIAELGFELKALNTFLTAQQSYLLKLRKEGS